MNSRIISLIPCVLISLFLMVLFDTPFFPSLSILILFYFLFLFVINSGDKITFRELAMTIASLQLLFTSLIAFYVSPPNPIFAPEGDPLDYFKFAIPGVLAYGLGLFALKIKYNIADILTSVKKYNLFAIGKQLLIIGLVAIPVQLITPASIGYFITLISFFAIIGGIMVLFSDAKPSIKNSLFFLSFLPTITSALSSGMFFLVLVWGVFLLIYYLISSQFSLTSRFLIIGIGLFFVVILDSVKKDYRAMLGDDVTLSSSEKAAVLGGLIVDNITFGQLSTESNISGRITRANQGALVTWVMNYVPKEEPYANGTTIKDAVVASLFPRFLMEDKAVAGGYVNFEKFTGRHLVGTSMNISLLGEGWANFGYYGGIIFMFCVGLFYCIIFKFIVIQSKTDPLIFFWIPFFFLFAIKAEDDLLTPLNHIVKSLLVYFVFYIVFLKKMYLVNRK